MDPPLEVDLAEPVDAEPLGDVDEVADLDRVAGEERDLLEQRRRPAYSPESGWMKPDSSGKNRLMSGRATSSVTRPPPPSLSDAVLDDRALVVALDVLQPRLVEQRPERPVDHPRVPVPHVRVGPDDEVAGGLVQRLPERLALATKEP